MKDAEPTGRGKGRRRVWKWVGLCALGTVATLAIVAAVMIRRASPILKGRIIETLTTRFESRVELDELRVSVLRGLEVSGEGLRIFPPASVVAAGASEPLIALTKFRFHSGLLGLFFKPTRVRAVHVDGLAIHIPPRELRQRAPKRTAQRQGGKVKIVVDEIICEGSQLVIGTAKPDKDPKDFELKRIALYNVGPNAPWRYEATLTNAVPPGEIRAKGTFGPWKTESPGDSTVTGHYTFEHADLNSIKGIGGMLSSTGNFRGQLARIEIDGRTDTPDFSLDTGERGVPLKTRFHAIVDGTSGDTYLQPVEATLGDSTFTTRGAVINIKGKGHRIELDVDVRQGQLKDFLELAVKTRPAVMTAVLTTRTKLQIRPGKERVAQKLSFQGGFTLTRMHFTNAKVQDKVDMLSLRAQGKPRQAKAGAADVRSHMEGRFGLNQGVIRFPMLTYELPGARVNLQGVYSLDGQQFDFRGKVRTKASLSQMVTSRWASLLLKAVPLFRKKGGGTEIPVKISGTKSEPKFGLDLF